MVQSGQLSAWCLGAYSCAGAGVVGLVLSGSCSFSSHACILLPFSMQVQCTGSSPTVSIDKCDGVQAYIPAVLSQNPNFQVSRLISLAH